MKLKANNYLNCKYISHILILMPQFGKRERLSTAPRAPLSFMTKPFNCLAASHCSSPLQHRLDSQRQLSKQTPSLNWLHWPPLHILPVLWSLLHQSLSFFFSFSFWFTFSSLPSLSPPRCVCLVGRWDESTHPQRFLGIPSPPFLFKNGTSFPPSMMLV